jgi:hypothetical protein
MFIPLQIPPGVYKNGTEYQSKGRYNDANLVRWYEGTMRPIGGWRKRQDTQLSGKPRGLITWRDNSGDRWIVVGTHSKLYVVNTLGTTKDITPTGFTVGDPDSTVKLGYGYGAYGVFAYGVARPDLGSFQPATTWALDTWGQNLIAISSSDGKIYEWGLGFSTPDLAEAVTNAPINNQSAVVTDERFLFALGAGGNPRKVQWSDQEDNTEWVPSTLNQAGDFELATVGTLQCGKRIRGATILFTDVDVHVATYIGPPYVYSFERAGTGCGVISKQAVAVNDNSAIWMSMNGFWFYDGFVKPLTSDVGDYVFNNMNYQQASKVYCVHQSRFGEVWWFYPSASSTEIDSYVLFNYRENHWSIGLLSRSAGADAGVFTNPLMVSPDGYVYEHEVGFDYDSATPYAESGPIEIAQGDRVVSVTGYIPDEKTQGDVQISFATKFYPNATEFNHGPYVMNSPTSVRLTGRQIAVKVEGARNAEWRVGIPRLDVVLGGKR